ncbi:hypothetical protein TSUD_170250 [Trifolium subterraneum]|uniref:Uncharacterized protein n=1 Tax=Trifolium subterraneum TaxID=3900 RepID=A0A2Z6M4L6_TRISU|nr:hypothetical protein TSUD_170250 [Trifolium subterraneum]
MFACNFLINRLVEYDQIETALDVYGRIKRLGLCPNLHTYGIVIKALCKKADYLKYAVRVFDEMTDAAVTPNSYCYEAYIEGLCNNCMSDLGYDVLQYHRERNAPIEVYAYAAVIRGFCNEMKLDKAEDVFYDMKWKGLVPDFNVYSSLIRGYCKSNDLGEMGMDSEVVDTFKELKQSGVFLDGVAYNIVFNSLCKLGKVDEAVDMLEELKSMHIDVDIKHYTTFISGYCLHGKTDVAYRIFKEMEENGFKPDVAAYNVLVSGLFRNHRDCEAVDLLSYMDSQGVKPNSTTHKITIEGLCSAGKVEDAEAYFNCRKDEGVEIYTAMVNGYCQAGLIEKSYELFCEISNQGDIAKEGSGFKQLSKVMYSKVLSALCQEIQKKEREKESALCQEIQKKEKEIALCQAGNMKRARSLFDFFLEKGFRPDVVTYTIMIKSYCIMNCLQEAHSLFQDMEIRGIKPDVITYTVLLDVGLKQFYSGHRKGKDVMYNVLTIWVDMKQMGISPDVVSYTVMIDGHMKIGNLENAIRYFNEMIVLRLEPDIVTYTALLSGLLKGGYTENAVLKEITLPSHIISKFEREERHRSSLDYVVRNLLTLLLKTDINDTKEAWKLVVCLSNKSLACPESSCTHYNGNAFDGCQAMDRHQSLKEDATDAQLRRRMVMVENHAYSDTLKNVRAALCKGRALKCYGRFLRKTQKHGNIFTFMKKLHFLAAKNHDFGSNIPSEIRDWRVKDAVTVQGKWDYEVLEQVVHPNVLQKLHAILPPSI